MRVAGEQKSGFALFRPSVFGRMRRMTKRSTLLISLCLFLAACGGSAEVACEQAYWDGTIGTCLPSGWKVVERGTLDARGVPTEVVAAFQAEKPFSGQFPTVTVTRETLTEEVTSAEYSEASVQAVQGLPAYEELDSRTVTVDERDVQLHIFSAQPRAEDPKARFYQVSFTGEGAGYTFTAAVPLSITDEMEEQILLVLENATVQEPADTEEAEEE
jgi:hypothetical protein